MIGTVGVRRWRYGRNDISIYPVLAGVIAPLLFFLLLTLAGAIRPGYSPVRQYGSALEVGPHAWLIHADFMLVGLLEMLFALGLQRGVARGSLARGSWLGPALIGIAGFGMLLIGTFSGGSMHLRAVKLHSYGLMASFVALAPRLRQDRRWHVYAPYGVAAAILAFIPWAAMTWDPGPRLIASIVGLVQRLHYAILLGWIEILALRLVRQSAMGDETTAA